MFMARVLGRLGAESDGVVHGADGMDELTTTGPSYVAELDKGAIKTFEVSPGDAGIAESKLVDLMGGDPETNAAAMRAVFAGEAGAYRDIVLYNAAAALIVAGRVDDLKAGVERAAEAIDSGAAQGKLDALVGITNSGGSA